MWSPLVNYSYYSLLQGTNHPKKIAKKAKELGYSSVGISDINTLAGSVAFCEACKEEDIKPIIGATIKSEDDQIVVFAKNYRGWKSVIQLVSRINVEKKIDRKVMNDIIVIPKCDSYNDLDGENNVTVCKYGDLAINPAHYTEQSEAHIHRILLCASMKKDMEKAMSEDHINRTFFDNDYFYILNEDEVKSKFHSEEIQKVEEIVSLCEEYEILKSPMLPEFECPDGMSEYDYLVHLCRQGWRDRLTGTDKIDNTEKKKRYELRIKEELEVIKEADLSGYFLIVQDILAFGRKKDWLVGPGRGSAAGCLISYLIGITDIDPIKHNLLFSRFYNSSRKGSLPDIDMDVQSGQREDYINYITSKYGENKVAQMVTYGRLMGRSAIKEVIRWEAPDLSFAEVNSITESIPDLAEVADDLKSVEETSLIRWSLKNHPGKFSRWCEIADDETLSGEYAEIFGHAIAIEGTPKSQGKHPAGIIITSEDKNIACPILLDKDGNSVAGIEMTELEKLGQVKLDLLGIDFLDKVDEISKASNLDLTNFEDQATWDLLCDGDTKGVFQLERQSRWTKKLKPRNLDHLAALTSIIRPGVVEATENGKSMTQHYIDRKNGEAETPSIHKDIDDILHETYGVLCYQETAMRLAKEVAGFTLNEADTLRKAIGKKKVELMAQVKTDFITKSEEKGKYRKETYEKIFDWIEKSQRYSFNASHAYSYAYNAYWSAYCKAHSPLKFYEVYLNHAHKKPDTFEEISQLINDARVHNIDILPPDLCNLYKDFTIVDGKIVFGLSHVKNIGNNDCDKLVELINSSPKDFCDFDWMDILLNIAPHINKRAFLALVYTGSLNAHNNRIDRECMAYEYDLWRQLTKREVEFISENRVGSELVNNIRHMVNEFKISSKRIDKVLSIINCLEHPTYDLNDVNKSIAVMERQYFGLPLSYKSETIYIQGDSTCKDISLGNVSGKVNVVGSLKSTREFKIKKEGPNLGRMMAFLELQDNTALLKNIVMFPEAFEQYNYMLYEDNTLCIQGKVEIRSGSPSLLVDKVIEV